MSRTSIGRDGGTAEHDASTAERDGAAVSVPHNVEDGAPAFTIGIPASAAEPDIEGALESLRVSAARTGERHEIVVAVNGPGDLAITGVEAFAARAGLPLVRDQVPTPPRPGPVGPAERAQTGVSIVRLLRLPVLSKVAAWNAIRAAARAPIIVFADADVRVAADAIGRLLVRLADEPALALVAGRESARLESRDGLAARVAALPYRFDFGNVPGRFYALRIATLPEPMPAHVLHEDAYLTVRLGRSRFVKESAAVVYLRPPLTWRDYLRQRVRNEVGMLQLAREFPELLARHGFGRYPWRAFLRGIAAREYPLVALLLATRLIAHRRARREVHDGFRGGWTLLPSTKRWAAPDAPVPPSGVTPAGGVRAARS